MRRSNTSKSADRQSLASDMCTVAEAHRYTRNMSLYVGSVTCANEPLVAMLPLVPPDGHAAGGLAAMHTRATPRGGAFGAADADARCRTAEVHGVAVLTLLRANRQRAQPELLEELVNGVKAVENGSAHAP